MPWMEKRCSSSGAASLSTLINRTLGSSSVAACSKIGAIARQGTAPGLPGNQPAAECHCALHACRSERRCSVRAGRLHKSGRWPIRTVALAQPFARHAIESQCGQTICRALGHVLLPKGLEWNSGRSGRLEEWLP